MESPHPVLATGKPCSPAAAQAAAGIADAKQGLGMIPVEGYTGEPDQVVRPRRIAGQCIHLFVGPGNSQPAGRVEIQRIFGLAGSVQLLDERPRHRVVRMQPIAATARSQWVEDKCAAGEE